MTRTGTARLVDAATVLDIDGTPLRVSVTGDGPVLLLCAGLASPIESWGPFVDALGGHRIVAFDVPGIGDSPPPSRPLTIPAAATLAAGVLTAVGVERAHVLGYSWGGALAQHLAWRHAAHVERLVLAATSVGVGSVPGVPWAALPTLGSMVGAAIGRSRATPVGVLAQVGAISGWSSLPWLCRIQARTLVLAGSADLVVPSSNAHLLAWGLPQAELTVLPGADHSLFAPPAVATVAARVRRFLTAE